MYSQRVGHQLFDFVASKLHVGGKVCFYDYLVLQAVKLVQTRDVNTRVL